ncbi:MAG: acyl-CoA dehydrogenase [Pseudomonadota bacterium]
MQFLFSEDQDALIEGVRSFLDGAHGPEKLRALDGTPGDGGVWDALVSLGLTGLLVPEDQGGLGSGLAAGTRIAVELGRANVGQPIVDTALIAAPWLMRKGATDRLADIAGGGCRIALAHPINPWIADLDGADYLLGDDGLIDAPETKALNTVDPLRSLFAPVDISGSDDLLDLAALMSAAQMLGATARMLELATDYAKDREQFGQPIGKFQAIKHQLATVAVKLEFARPVLWRAAVALDERQPRASMHVSHAKLAATDAAMLAAETAIQIHGAMGYTYEVDLHFWMKRAWALAGAWGDRAWHFNRCDAAVIGGQIALGPDQTFESEFNNA